MDYYLSKDVMSDERLRHAFNELSTNVFGLSFEKWYQEGYCSDLYLPYTLFDGNKAISNVSVNRMEVLIQDKTRNYIQLGTVMTDPAYRRKGLSRYIMEQIMKDWTGQYDAMFLFANKSVLDFYPKFGFQKEMQYQYHIEIKGSPVPNIKKLNMDSPRYRQFLKKYYDKTNPFSRMQVMNNYGLLMFYCISPMRECVYYCPQHDAIIIGEQDKEVLYCYDVYCDKGKDLAEILSYAAAADTQKVILEFTPQSSGGFDVIPYDDMDDTLFVLRDGENIFRNHRRFFPSISHT